MAIGRGIEMILERAESQLLELVGLAAKDGDYDGIDAAREAARSIREARNRMGYCAERPQILEDLVAPSAEPRSRVGNRPKFKNSYPKFSVDGSTLVKTGWSKKKREEYVQRVPAEVFGHVLRSLKALEGRAGAVKSEEILQSLETQGEEVPSYQTYAVVGFLRHCGVLRQVNRGEYSIPNDVGNAATDAWERTRGSHSAAA